MTTKKEILKMSKDELHNYKWNGDLDLNKENSSCFNCSNCSNCFDCFYCSYCFGCFDCSDCSNCFNCSDCSNCRNLKDGKKHQYKICNVQLTKKEYKKKMKEISGEKESRESK